MQNREEENPFREHVVLQMEEQQQASKFTIETDFNCREHSQSAQSYKPRTTLGELDFTRTKSRFAETSYPLLTRSPIIHKISASDDEEEEEAWNIEHEEDRKKYIKKKKKVGCITIIEWVLTFVITTGFMCCLTVDSFKNQTKWGLEIWKWCLLVMVVISGRMFSGWVVRIIVFFVERNYMLREKVLYFVYGPRKSFQNCIWLGFILLSWSLLVSPDVQKNTEIFKKVFRALIGVLVGAIIWLTKIVFVKVLASSFHVATFFDRMKESVFHHYILDSLSGPEIDQTLPDKQKIFKPSRSFGTQKDEEKVSKTGGPKKIDIERLRNIPRLVNYVMYSGLSTISRTLDNCGSSKITSESEARITAQRVFKHVAQPDAKYILEEDLLRFLRREDIDTILPFFECTAGETVLVKKSAFRNWVVQAYTERKALTHSLNDTKTAVQQLHKLASAVVSMLIVVVFVLVMGLATSKVILVITSQLLLVGFMFQNTCKTIFEAIIFVFVMHPFDVGDRCKIDGIMMTVEEMNIFTTVFLKNDKEKVYYPNSVLSTKAISNFYRSPDMLDYVDFAMDSSTSMDTVTLLKEDIKKYIDGKPKYWAPKHALYVKQISTLDKLDMCLLVTHTMNYQNYLERQLRRTELIYELKKIFETLQIKYRLLPQQVHLTQFSTVHGGSTSQP
ncbi:hypothetical protein MKW98_014561 [Papaver atlanticum]|uniref:Mechanosensitive ion channel protein n=1 Tax=Papaver atlanticum TaxID=357466 RepID=A0AAD4XDH3_9MAGN|nr:hypothetical protein MKW98_014561 [Papaver atlanticum]